MNAPSLTSIARGTSRALGLFPLSFFLFLSFSRTLSLALSLSFFLSVSFPLRPSLPWSGSYRMVATLVHTHSLIRFARAGKASFLSSTCCKTVPIYPSHWLQSFRTSLQRWWLSLKRACVRPLPVRSHTWMRASTYCASVIVLSAFDFRSISLFLSFSLFVYVCMCVCVLVCKYVYCL